MREPESCARRRFHLLSRDSRLAWLGNDVPLLGAEHGSVHMRIKAHRDSVATPLLVHAFDKTIYILSGEVSLRREEQNIRIAKGGHALIRAGQRHQLSARDRSAEWIEICAPQPRPPESACSDSIELPVLDRDADGQLDPRSANVEGCGKFDGQMPPPFEPSPEMSGVSVRMLIDAAQGAAHSNLFVVDFQPGAICDHHDHPFEEAYFLLSGEVELTVEGCRHRLRAGDFAWTGVGTAHAFRATRPASWIEVQSPLPPQRDAMRWHGQWSRLFSSLVTGGRSPREPNNQSSGTHGS